MFFFPGKNIPEWFTPRTSVKKVPTSRVATKQEIEGSLYFQFRNKFPTICLCLVIGLGNEQPIQVKFSLQVFINGNKKRIGCQQVYEFKIDTDHVFLLKIEDNEDIVFSDNKWNSVEVSFVDHITNDEEPIRQVSRYSGIHVFEQTIDPEDIQFIDASQRMINTNLNPNSMEGAHQKVKVKISCPPFLYLFPIPIFLLFFYFSCFGLFICSDHSRETPERPNKCVIFTHCVIDPTSTSNH